MTRADLEIPLRRCCALLLVLAPSPTSAAPESPRVLVVRAGADRAAQQRDKRFIEQLGLSLDTLTVVAVRFSPRQLSQTEFSALPLERQVELLKPTLAARGARAALWLAQQRDGAVVLHFLAVGAGRAQARLVEARAGTQTAADLALAARELLVAAQILDASAPSSTRRVQPPAPGGALAPSQADAGVPPWEVSLLFQVAGTPGEAGSTQLGGAAALQRRFSAGLSAGVRLDGRQGPTTAQAAFELTGWSFGVGAGASYAWQLGRAQFGADLGARLRLQRLTLTAGSAGESAITAWRPELYARLLLAARLTRRLSIVITTGPALALARDAFERRSDGQELYRTAAWEWEASAGLRVALGP